MSTILDAKDKSLGKTVFPYSGSEMLDVLWKMIPVTGFLLKLAWQILKYILMWKCACMRLCHYREAGPGCLVHHCNLIQCLAHSRCSAIQTEWKCNILAVDCGRGGEAAFSKQSLP